MQFHQSFEYDFHHSNVGSLLQDKYEILEEIHRSVHTIITKLQHKENKKYFVLKAVKIRTDYKFDIDMLLSIEVEGVQKIREVFESKNFIYLVEDFIDGSNLEEYVKTNGVLSVQNAKVLILQIARILHRLHQHGNRNFIFRDLKPSNIMIEKNQKITLIDIVTIREKKEVKTQDTILIGTMGYTAPEAYGFMQTSVQSDIYSLGATAFYLITGVEPSNISSFTNYFKENKDIKYKDLILKATAFNPKDRFVDVEAFIKNLEHENKIRHRKAYFYMAAVLVLMIFILSLKYPDKEKGLSENTATPEVETAEVQVETTEHFFDSSSIDQLDDIDMRKIEELENIFNFEKHINGLVIVKIDQTKLSERVSDFEYMAVATSDIPFTDKVVHQLIFSHTTDFGYQSYEEYGYYAQFDNRKAALIILFSEQGEPLAYYNTDNIFRSSSVDVSEDDKVQVNMNDNVPSKVKTDQVEPIQNTKTETNEQQVVPQTTTAVELPQNNKIETTEQVVDLQSLTDMEYPDINSVVEVENIFDFVMYNDKTVIVKLDNTKVSGDASDFKYITVFSSYVPFLDERINDILSSDPQSIAYHLVDDRGFYSGLESRKSILVILANEKKEPQAYFKTDDVTQLVRENN